MEWAFLGVIGADMVVSLGDTVPYLRRPSRSLANGIGGRGARLGLKFGQPLSLRLGQRGLGVRLKLR